nr:hypothetical protein [Tanacetum cinerariifolium]
METTIDQQSKESTLQVIYDVLRNSPFFKAFLVTVDVPEIYMQEFWATAKLHQHSIRFKMDTRKSVLDLEAFREMLHISPRIPSQSFTKLPFEEEILEFLRFLRHSNEIRYLTDDYGNHNRSTADVPKIYMQEFWATAKLHHNSIRFKIDTKKSVLDLEAFREMMHISPRIPNQSFAELPSEKEILDFLRILRHMINKCLTGKSYGVDSFRLSQAQILWGLYHRRNVDFAYLIWEDFVYQVEHKNTKKSNEMYYPRFTKVIIDYFMTRKPSISRRNKINWHYVRDDVLFSTIKVVSRHQTTQQYGAILLIELTTDEIRNSKAYKEYYACATGEATPKPKASTDEGTGSKPGVPDVPSDDSEEELSWNSSDDEEVGEPTKEREESEGDKSDESDDERDDDSDETIKAGSEKDKDDDDNKDDEDNDEEEELAKNDDEDTETGKGGDEVSESEGESDEEETRQEEEGSFDPIPRTPKGSEEESNNEEDQEVRLSEEARIQEEEEFIDVVVRDKHAKPDQRFEAYDVDKAILDTYGESTILKRRREDDDQEGPSAGLDRGSKRRREGGEHASASTLFEIAIGSAGRSTTGSQSRQLSASESAFCRGTCADYLSDGGTLTSGV